jgi:hypothetical protein
MIATEPEPVIRAMNGACVVATIRNIRGIATTIDSAISTPLMLPPVNTNARTCAATSASRSIGRLRISLSFVRTIQPS